MLRTNTQLIKRMLKYKIITEKIISSVEITTEKNESFGEAWLYVDEIHSILKLNGMLFIFCVINPSPKISVCWIVVIAICEKPSNKI